MCQTQAKKASLGAGSGGGGRCGGGRAEQSPALQGTIGSEPGRRLSVQHIPIPALWHEERFHCFLLTDCLHPKETPALPLGPIMGVPGPTEF